MTLLDQLKKLHGEATAGPWKIEPHDDCDKSFRVGPVIIDYDDVDHDEEDANAKLVRALRNALPRLLAVVEALEKLPADKMRLLADWMDAEHQTGRWDGANGSYEVQRDLRAFAAARDAALSPFLSEVKT